MIWMNTHLVKAVAFSISHGSHALAQRLSELYIDWGSGSIDCGEGAYSSHFYLSIQHQYK